MGKGEKNARPRPKKTLWKLVKVNRHVYARVFVSLSVKAQDDIQVEGGRRESASMADAWHRANLPLVTATWIAKHNPVINPSSVSHSAPYILFDTHVH